MRRYLIMSFLTLTLPLTAQVNVADSTTQGWLFHLTTSYHLKGGDFSSYLGPNFGIGGDLQYKLKSNWTISAGGRYQFADNLRDGNRIFGNLLTDNGELLALNGQYSFARFRERGWNAGVDVGYIFDRFGHNRNSGLYVSAGVGYNSHWIDIRNQENNTPQVQGEYLKGYDRRTEGVLTRQYVGYMFAGSQRRINFTIGFEFMQGFNRNLREFNYDTRMPDLDSKLDLYYGVRFSWFLPVYDQNAQKFYYY